MSKCVAQVAGRSLLINSTPGVDDNGRFREGRDTAIMTHRPNIMNQVQRARLSRGGISFGCVRGKGKGKGGGGKLLRGGRQWPRWRPNICPQQQSAEKRERERELDCLARLKRLSCREQWTKTSRSPSSQITTTAQERKEPTHPLRNYICTPPCGDSGRDEYFPSCRRTKRQLRESQRACAGEDLTNQHAEARRCRQLHLPSPLTYKQHSSSLTCVSRSHKK